MLRPAALALADCLWSVERKTRIRLQQWSLTVVIYIASGGVMGAGAAAGWLPAWAWQGWCAFVALGLSGFYVAIRSGWSQRHSVEGSLTEAQTVVAVTAAVWGYLMCGAMRSAALFPMMMIMCFGAFALSWRRMALLTAFALLELAGAMLALHRIQPGVLDPHLDIANLLSVAVILPATSALAARLGALRRRLRSQRDELTAALARINELAIRDELTGLANRRHAQTLLEQERQRSERSRRGWALALLDIDHFKRINDVHGHDAGDKALQDFARQAEVCLRANDTVARWGGEEFLVLMPETTLQEAHDALERLRGDVCRVSAEAPFAELRFTVSAGVAQARADEAVADLVARADRALYEAKRGGRNRVVADAGAVAEPAGGQQPSLYESSER